MPKAITLDHVRVVGLAIQPAEVGYSVSVEQRLEKADCTLNLSKSLAFYSSTTSSPGRPWPTVRSRSISEHAEGVQVVEGDHR
ncbi:MAG: hypothetical protein OEU56_24060 [Rhodospirillales bacterium]|nr:hypothetical protein [Rhodospirillales bacterium]